MRVVVLHGGYSSEHFYSTENAMCVAEALLRRGYDALLLEYDSYMVENLKKLSPDVVFLCVQGRFHGDGTVQGVLDFLKIPYTGSPMQPAALINDKNYCQAVFEEAGASVAKHFTFKREEFTKPEGRDLFLRRIRQKNMDFPVVAKAPSEGACIGINLISSLDEYLKMEESFKFGDKILVEEYIDGYGFTVPLLESKSGWITFPAVTGAKLCKLENGEQFFDTKKDLTLTNLPTDVLERVNKQACDVANAVGARGYTRVDFIYDEKNRQEYVAEINAVPGLCTTSLFPASAKLAGIDYDDLIEKILLNVFIK